MNDNPIGPDELYEADIKYLLWSTATRDADDRMMADHVIQSQAQLDGMLRGMSEALAQRLEKRQRRRRRLTTSALLAAAAVAGIWIVPRLRTPEALEQPMTNLVGLDVAPANRFAVFPTDNPSISVVWVFQEK